MMIKNLDEMSRGPQKKLPKYKARDIAAECLWDEVAKAYYSLTDDPDFDKKYTQEEQDMIMDYYDELGKKMCKVIGKEFYTV